MQFSLRDVKRFMNFVETPADDCWEWTGAKNRDGYGSFHIGGRRNRKAFSSHKFSYLVCRGPIQKGIELHHACNNKSCVNPNHLFLFDRSSHPGSGADLQRSKTHCPAGHPYDETNTHRYIYQGKRCRRCRICHREKSKQSYYRRKHVRQD